MGSEEYFMGSLVSMLSAKSWWTGGGARLSTDAM
jgi:hypothetical protein